MNKLPRWHCADVRLSDATTVNRTSSAANYHCNEQQVTFWAIDNFDGFRISKMPRKRHNWVRNSNSYRRTVKMFAAEQIGNQFQLSTAGDRRDETRSRRNCFKLVCEPEQPIRTCLECLPKKVEKKKTQTNRAWDVSAEKKLTWLRMCQCGECLQFYVWWVHLTQSKMWIKFVMQ